MDPPILEVGPEGAGEGVAGSGEEDKEQATFRILYVIAFWIVLIMHPDASANHPAIKEVVERTSVVEHGTERLLQVQTSEFGRDGLLRRQRTEFPVRSVVDATFHYDAGVLVRVEHRDEHRQLLGENTYEYDAGSGRLVDEAHRRGGKIVWRREIAYAGDGSRTERETFEQPRVVYELLGRRYGIPPSERQISRLDPDGHLRSVVFLDGAAREVAELRIRYEPSGNVSEVDLRIADLDEPSDPAEGLELRTRYTYDANGALLDTTTTLNDEVLERDPQLPRDHSAASRPTPCTYKHDEAGNWIERTEGHHEGEKFVPSTVTRREIAYY